MSSTQMLKGILEGCLLAIISKGETYGYEMIEKLEAHGFHMVSEGSIYPLLLRMQKEKLITSIMKASPNGPKRKYYTLTPEGQQELKDFQERWNSLSYSVNQLMNNKRKKGE